MAKITDLFEFAGKKYTFHQLVIKSGLSKEVLYGRLIKRNWDVYKAVTQPLRKDMKKEDYIEEDEYIEYNPYKGLLDNKTDAELNILARKEFMPVSVLIDIRDKKIIMTDYVYQKIKKYLDK